MEKQVQGPEGSDLLATPTTDRPKVCVGCGSSTQQRCPRGCGVSVHKRCDREHHRQQCAKPTERRRKAAPARRESTECSLCDTMTTDACQWCHAPMHLRHQAKHRQTCIPYEEATVPSMAATLAAPIIPLLVQLDFDVQTYDELVDVAYGDRPGRWPDWFVADWRFVSFDSLQCHQMTI